MEHKLDSRFIALFDYSDDIYNDRCSPEKYLDELGISYQELHNGPCSKVFVVESQDSKYIYKFACSKHRQIELYREYLVLKTLSQLKLDFIPNTFDYIELEDMGMSLMIQAFITGNELRSIINDSRKLILWEKVGKALSEIHNTNVIDNVNNWVDCQLKIGMKNMKRGFIDPAEFIGTMASNELDWLINNRVEPKCLSLIHGDFRTKNIIVNDEDDIFIIDWGFVDFGDPKYDLSMIEYYMTSNQEIEAFYKGYGTDKCDQSDIRYYDVLSKFINV